MKKALSLTLPYPPSVNHYWRRVGARTLISREGRAFRYKVAIACSHVGPRPVLFGRLKVRIVAHPPDNRRRDLDNLFKAVLDALEYTRIYENDSQIDRLSIERGAVCDGGGLDLFIEEIAR